jgi:pimeloyl-ACP methyl ester carboxylesterase
VPGNPANPQSWNAYTYVLGNPSNAFDPLGLLTIVVPGTTASCDDPDYRAGSDFMNAVGQTFNETPQCFESNISLPGALYPYYYGIWQAGYRLAGFINGYQFAPGEPLNIVGHSHGGNVAIIAANNLRPGLKVTTLVLLGTPHNIDLPKLQEGRTGNFCAVSSITDFFQVWAQPSPRRRCILPMQRVIQGLVAHITPHGSLRRRG